MSAGLIYIHKHNNLDSPYQYNLKDKDIIPKGVYKGADLLEGPNKTVDVTPFVCKTFDGATVRCNNGQDGTMDTADNINIQMPQDGKWYYIGLFAKYVVRGTPVNEVCLKFVDDYPTWNEKDWYIIFGKARLSDDGTVLDIDKTSKETPGSREGYSKIILVNNYNELPADAEKEDTRFVISENTFYIFDGTKWRKESSGILCGTASFKDGGTKIEHNLGHANYRVSITPIEFADCDIGEHFTLKSNDDIRVFRAGFAETRFDWIIVVG